MRTPEPIAYLYQHDETGRVTLRMASERMNEPRWHEYPLFAHPPQPISRVGWKLVPDTATHNMLNAANAGRKKGRSSSGEIYRAMLDAAPSATTAGEAS